MPAILGAAFGWWATSSFDWVSLAFLVIGVLASAFAYQAFNRYYDEVMSATARLQSTGVVGGAGAPAANSDAPVFLLNLGYLLLVLGGLCAFWLALLTGWPILFFSGSSFLLLIGAVLPPVRYASRGFGMGELGLLLSFGLLPLLGGYYAMTQSLNWLPVAAGWPLALLALVVIHNQNLADWRRDWLVGKRTLAVSLGGARALDLSSLLTIVAYAGILLMTIFLRLPLWYLVGLATLPLALGAFADVQRSAVTPEDGDRLRAASAKAAIWTGVLLIAALFISHTG
jgi:1,4-dihydroxy-2-naphthoate octaprenyltransferase